MPRPAKGPRLYLRERKGREAIFVIRDDSKEVWPRDERGSVITDSGPECRAEAEKALAAYLGKKHQPNFRDGTPHKVLVTDILKLYADEVAPLMARPELAGFEIERLLGFFANKVVAEVTKGTCRGYVAWRTAQPRRQFKDPDAAPRITVSTARRELVTLKASINYAWKEGKLAAPVPVHLPPERAGRTRWLTRAEAARLLWAAWRTNKHVAKFILLGLYTGSRHSAILGLRWIPDPDTGWIDLENGLIYRRGVDEQETKKRRPPVPISDRLAAHLRRWKKVPSTFVMEWEGERLLKLRRSWNRARRLAGLGPDVTPHILRHTFATWALQEGVSLAKVAGTIGSTESMIEDRYGHHHPDHLRDVVSAVSGAYLGRRIKQKAKSRP
jgi:integrase